MGLDLDTIIDDIHRVREQMAAKFGGDLDAILEDARIRQNASGCAVWRGPSASNASSLPPGAAQTPGVSDSSPIDGAQRP